MPVISIGVGGQAPSVPTHPKMTIRSESGVVLFTAPYAPQKVTHDGIAPTYASDDRPGRKPLYTLAGLGLEKMSFSLYLAYPDLQRSVEPLHKQLSELVGTGQRVVVNYGPMESGVWNLDGMTVTSETRSATTNEITRSTVDLTFTEVSNYVVNVGPVTGGVQPPGGTQPVTGSRGTATTYYTVKKGDTLWAIAVAYYKDGSKWPQIADANGIRNPSALSIGRKLVIPSPTQIAAVIQAKSVAKTYVNPVTGVQKTDSFGFGATPTYSPDPVSTPGGKTRVTAI